MGINGSTFIVLLEKGGISCRVFKQRPGPCSEALARQGQQLASDVGKHLSALLDTEEVWELD